MRKLSLPTNIEFQNHKGFVIKVDPVDDSLSEFVGLAVNEEKTAKFVATGKTRNEVGRELERYIDNYRKFERRRLIVS